MESFHDRNREWDSRDEEDSSNEMEEEEVEEEEMRRGKEGNVKKFPDFDAHQDLVSTCILETGTMTFPPSPSSSSSPFSSPYPSKAPVLFLTSFPVTFESDNDTPVFDIRTCSQNIKDKYKEYITIGIEQSNKVGKLTCC